MATALTTVTEQAGIGAISTLAATELGWVFRHLATADVGIDGQLEVVVDGAASGRLLGVQVKAGPSYFATPTPAKDGWVYFETDKVHRDYWLNYDLPVLLALYDPTAKTAYWQHITPETAQVTGKGFKVIVPAHQRLDVTARDALEAIARRTPETHFAQMLHELPAYCAHDLRSLETTHVPLARALADRLDAGRAQPAGVVDQLLNQPLSATGTPRKKPKKRKKNASDTTMTWPAAAWLAVGEFANEYGLSTQAAECFLHAESTGTTPAGRCTAFAALMLSDVDPERARSLLETVREHPAARLLASVGLAWLDRDKPTDPIPVPAEVLADSEGTAQDPTVQRFLGDCRLRAGDLVGAIEHHQRALELAPESVEQQLELAEVLLRRGSSAPGTQRLPDVRRVAHLAEAARAARRRWWGDSVRAAELLMRARLLSDEHGSALRVAAAAPVGEATAAEAASPVLAGQAAHAAYQYGQLERGDEFAAVVAESTSLSWKTRLAAVRATVLDAPIDEQQRLWQEALAAADEDGMRMIACHHLAGLGVWPIPELDELYEVHLISPAVYHTLRARALDAVGEHEQALVLLRQYRHDSLLTAEIYTRFLAAADRTDECVQACEQASTRFAEPRLDLLALDVLQKAGRTTDVRAKAAAILGRPSLGFQLRHHVRRLLIRQEGERREWAACERLATDGLHEVATLRENLHAGRTDPLTLPATAQDELARLHTEYSWTIIINQFNQGQITTAMATLDDLRPAISTPVEARVWLDLHHVSGWTATAVGTALDLAERPDMPSDLVGRILFTLVQVLPSPEATDSPADATPALSTGLVVPPDVHERLGIAWRAHLKTTPAGVETFSTDSADFPTALATVLASHAPNAQQAHHAQQVQEGIWNGQLPVGTASTVSGKPLLLGLLQRVTTVLPAIPLNPEVRALEVATAVDALGAPVCVDTTALYVAAAVLHQWPVLSAQFMEILLPEPIQADIFTTQVAVHALTNVVGYASIDPASGGLSVSALGNQARNRMRRYSHAVRDSAQSCRIVPVADVANLDTDAPMEAVGAWMAPVSVALAQGVALYSDDVVLRAAARAHGVPAFGTLALLDALAQNAPVDGGTVATTLSTLFENYVVDLPITPGFLLSYAQTHAPATGPILIALSRPATWMVDHLTVLQTVIHLVRSVPDEDRQGLAELVTAAATGLAACFEPQHKVLSLLGVSVLLDGTGLDADAAAVVVPAIGNVAARYGVDLLPSLCAHVMAALTDPGGAFRLTADAAQQQVDEALGEL